ncbi:4'-phosphopantetheinyl transferase family protein [Streptomyces sp. NBC_01257]|uniref:4'-phosphopantetheinyl transferase family protein n=1 Tax=Streptomyces sp. NBC_01257 TaxID=2903799 RepID=UPI002DD963AF|nr:4'-phosphopantetheinyl transferase superfamily protein [Streptomyces sp. NBC_01257]WRZ67190.1 4'-phosphopantetheinyl transferase superfamily protein [Streptomyces sp. NBC_01257]
MTVPHPAVAPAGPHIWWFTVPPPGADTAAAERLLGPRQRERAARLRRPLSRHRKIMAHAALRVLIAARLGGEPGELELGRAVCPECGGPHGRPFVAGARGFEFSMAHTGDEAVYAFADEPVGVDVENGRVAERTVRTVARWLPPGQRTLLDTLPEAERSAAFARLWVRTEALAKGRGTGLAHGLGAAPDASAEPRWRLVDLRAPDGLVAALAVSARDATAPPRPRSGRLPAASVIDAAGRARAPGRAARARHDPNPAPDNGGRAHDARQ